MTFQYLDNGEIHITLASGDKIEVKEHDKGCDIKVERIEHKKRSYFNTGAKQSPWTSNHIAEEQSIELTDELHFPADAYKLKVNVSHVFEGNVLTYATNLYKGKSEKESYISPISKGDK